MEGSAFESSDSSSGLAPHLPCPVVCLISGHAGILDMFSHGGLSFLTPAAGELLSSPHCGAHASAICLVGTGYLFGISLDPLKCNGIQQIHERLCEPCIVQGSTWRKLFPNR